MLALTVALPRPQMAAESGGGGGGSLALPVVMDFAAGSYTSNGSAVTLADLFREDTNYNAWDPASVVGGTGLVGGASANPVSTPALAALVLGGATYVLEYVTTGSQSLASAIEIDLMDLPGFAHGAFMWAGAHVGQSNIGRDGASVVWLGTTANGAHKIACTISRTHAAASREGASVAATTFASLETDPTDIGLTIAAVITLTKLTIQAAEAADATLETLSA